MTLKTIQNFAHQHALWQPKAKIVVAVSGGADSSCLLHVLTVLAKKYQFTLHLAHVNYHLREIDADKDELFVRKLAAKYESPLTVFSFPKAKNKKPTEEELRQVRYAFLEQLRCDLNFELIAIAHNQDDQAETVLLRLVRGAGLAGLAAMKAKNGNIIRPLLVLNRKQILAYLKENQLKYRTDKTNFQPLYTRNKIRLELLPLLEKKYNPRIKENLSFLSSVIGQDYDYLLTQATAQLKFTPEKQGLSFEVTWLLNLHPSLQRNCLRLLIAQLKTDLTGIELAHIEEIIKLVKSCKSKTQKTAFQGLNITRKGVKVYMINK